MTPYQVIKNGLNRKEVPGGVDHGGSEFEARSVIHSDIIDQELFIQQTN